MLFVIFYIIYFFFFFQAEDGIRDRDVTGVQTCALRSHVCSKLKHPLLVAREIPVSVNLPSAAGVMGKWESHGVGVIPKRGGKVCFWDFSTERLFHNPSRPRLR